MRIDVTYKRTVEIKDVKGGRCVDLRGMPYIVLSSMEWGCGVYIADLVNGEVKRVDPHEDVVELDAKVVIE